MTPRLAILPAVLLGGLWALGGCGEPARPAVCSYLSSPADLHRIGRVVFVELADESAHPKVAQDLSEDLFRALQDRRLFRVELVQAADPRVAGPLRSDGRLTLKEMKQWRDSLDCDAVLLGEISSFQQYPCMQVGLRLSLLDLKNGKAVWSIDNVWDTRDRDVERRIREFFEERMAHNYEPVNWQIGTVSASAFAKFVAYEVADTLPTRPCP